MFQQTRLLYIYGWSRVINNTSASHAALKVIGSQGRRNWRLTYSRIRTHHCSAAHKYWNTEVWRTILKKRSSDLDESERTGVAAVQCSLAGAPDGFLLSCAKGSRGQRGLETFLEGSPPIPQQQLFWNEADVNNYWAKRSWRGGNRGD